jgi:hypothetical protein
LQQIAWQAMGSAAFSDPEVVALLAITQAQQTTIANITNESRSKRMTLQIAGVGTEDGRGNFAELTAKMRTLAKEQDAKINEVLTKAQLDHFAELKGPDFEVNPLLDDDQIP